LGILSDSRPTTSAARSKNLDWAIEAETLLNQVEHYCNAFRRIRDLPRTLARLKELQPNRRRNLE